jgi:ABC-2 type transport system permease protein
MNTLTICRKELSSYFRSPIAYGVMAFFAIITGFFFYSGVRLFVVQQVRMSMMGQSVPLNVDEWVVRNVLQNIAVIGLFVIPMITMRLFAEEKGAGTIELLVTSPIRDNEIIVGKWLAALILYACMLGLSLINMGVLFAYGKPDWRPMMIGYLGLVLQGGCLLAIGTWISTWSKKQIVAGVAGFAICLLLWVLEWVSSFESSTTLQVLAYMSVLSHFDTFSRGVLDLKDAVYYLTMIALGLFLTARSMESMRWRA